MDKGRSAGVPSETLITKKAGMTNLLALGNDIQPMEVNVLVTTHAETLAALKITSQLGKAIEERRPPSNLRESQVRSHA